MDGDFAAALDGRRPGTALHAPQVRLVTDKGEPIRVEGDPVSADIVSAVVSLPNSGVATADIVLNNQRNSKSNPNRPFTPVWRYNRLAEVSFGKVFRIDYRYGQDPWTPMMLARITGVDFSFPSAAGAQVTLKGEDPSSLLRVRPGAERDEPYVDQEIAVVRGEVGAGAPDLRMASPAPDSPFGQAFTITPPVDKTRLEFIQDLAKRMDYEVFVAFDDDGPIAATGAVERPVAFHFEPSRSANADRLITLVWGRDIIDFKPKFSVWDVPTEATASCNAPGDRGRIDGTAVCGDPGKPVVNDLHKSADGAAPIDAVKARNEYFQARPEKNPITVRITNLDQQRADLAALAALREGIRSFLTAEASTVGLPSIRPGIHVDLKGFHAPFDGVWYVTMATHTLNATGYTTKVALRRPGMLDPAGYPGRGA